MFSIFYKILETKIPENIRIVSTISTISAGMAARTKPKNQKRTEYVIIKGKLGQYTLKLYQTPLNFSLSEKLDNAITAVNQIRLSSNDTGNNENNNAAKAKHFMYINFTRNGEAATATLKKKMRSSTLGITEAELVDVEISNCYGSQGLHEETSGVANENIWPTPMSRAVFANKPKTFSQKLFLGCTLFFGRKANHNFFCHENNIVTTNDLETSIWNGFEKEKNAKQSKEWQRSHAILNQLKTIFTGITQGYSVNLELKGIGFTGNIRQLSLTTKPLVKNTFQKKKTYVFDNTEKNQFFDKLEYLSVKRTQGMAQQAQIKQDVCDNANGNAAYISVKPVAPERTTKKALKVLYLTIGYSHNIVYLIPEQNVTINIGNVSVNNASNIANTLTLFGISKQQVYQVAANIYKFKKPEPYKGKGIRYDAEKLFMKQKQKK